MSKGQFYVVITGRVPNLLEIMNLLKGLKVWGSTALILFRRVTMNDLVEP